MRKTVLRKYKIFDGVSFATSFTSPVTNVEYLDSICIQLNWVTADAVGNLIVEISLDGDFWTPILTATAAGVDDHALFNITLLPAPLIRVRYDRTSGDDGVVNGYISAKML